MRPFVLLVAIVALALPAAVEGHASPREQTRDDTGTTRVVVSGPVEAISLPAGVSVDPLDDHLLVVGGDAPPTLRLLARDGHVSTLIRSGSGIGSVDRLDSAWIAVGRALVGVALVVLLGIVGTVALVVVPAVRSPIVPPGSRQPAAPDLRPPGWMRTVWLALCAAGGVGASIVLVATHAAVPHLSHGSLVTETRLGRVVLTVVAGLAAAAIVAALGRGAPITNARLGALGVGPAVGLVALSATGHATAGGDAVLGGIFDATHHGATAVWVGGLVVLAVALPLVRAETGEAGKGRLAAIVVRFSAVATVCVAVLAVTGTYRALGEVRGFADLVDSGYGRALLVKLGLFALLLGFGAVNRFVLHPRLERAAIGLAESDRGASRTLATSIRAELALALAVIAVVAVMVGFPPTA